MKKIMKLILLCLFCMVSLGASAFEVDGIYYNITSSSSPYTVEVTNNNNFGTYSGVVNIPSSVAYNGKTYSVTSIGDYAFEYCSGLTSITIPNSVTSIGDYAFFNCTDLTSIEIPNSVTSIGEVAFALCEGLTSIKIPNSVTSIEKKAFANCSGLTSVTIGNSVTSIGDWAFDNCSGLTSVTIPNSVTSIEKQAFYYCSGLTSIEIPNSVTSIGYCAFYGCSGLTSIEIPNSVTSIGDATFADCSGLTSVTNLATEPQQITSDVFNKYGTLHVLKGYKDVYAATDVWKNFTIVDDAEDPTGIEEIIDNGKLKIDNSSVFDLQGKRVERMKQGEVYIRDGRKFIAK